MLSSRHQNHRAFSLVEILVVIGVIAVLIGILLPVIHRTRERAKTALCASNLSQIGKAFAAYVAENRGVTPRLGYYDEPRWPLWLAKIPPYLGAPRDFAWSDLPHVGALQCPSHPTQGIPSGYVLNAFAFETRPAWDGSPPIPMGKVRNAASVAWLLEASNSFGESNYLFDGIYYEPYHIVRAPEQLAQRVNMSRHGRAGSNVLLADGHVSALHPRDLRLEIMDDGIRQR
jgi:prepilin-type N-terminal cleavage/methylation domain-containing protein/prepilin-type processing-associated H-X9-DG protein